MLVILPFEAAFYRKWHYPVTYVGHPLMEVVKNELAIPVTPISPRPIIALLPGSRKQEIKAKLPEMLQMVPLFPQYQFVIAQAPAQPEELYRQLIGHAPVLLVQNQTYNLLKQAQAALVTSGTATLETALFGVPQVVCYKGNPISYQLAKRLIRVKYISLVNLIMDRLLVQELIQQELTVPKLQQALHALLQDTRQRAAMQQGYQELGTLLGAGHASENAAREIYSFVAAQ
jgi:lipid-A-disaccharide synthase